MSEYDRMKEYKDTILAKEKVRDKVCAEIQDIMRVYREQEKTGNVDSPGGLEHMGDVWSKFAQWDRELRA